MRCIPLAYSCATALKLLPEARAQTLLIRGHLLHQFQDPTTRSISNEDDLDKYAE
jgi:hypothetical protein